MRKYVNFLTKIIFITLFVLLFWACRSIPQQPIKDGTISPSVTNTTPPPTPVPSITSTPTRNKSANFPGKPINSPFPPYSLKHVIFHYFICGGHADYELFLPDGILGTNLVLYDDGQMILNGPDNTYNQVFLSNSEINYFLSYIETLGFFSLESNQEHDPTDALYRFEGEYIQYGDGEKICISMDADRNRTLCARDLYLPDLIPKMKNLLKYLDDYQSQGMTEYISDRVILAIQTPSHSDDLPPAIPWDESFPSLERVSGRLYADNRNLVIFLDGELAKDIYHFFNGEYMKVVLDDNKEYIVYLHVVLPHEEIINPPR